MEKITGPEWVFVVILLFFAAGLRIIGISSGQPDPQYDRSTYPRQMIHYQTPMQPDEYEFVAIPFQMVVQKTLTKSLSELRNEGFDYVIQSDSWHLTIQRGWEIIPVTRSGKLRLFREQAGRSCPHRPAYLDGL